MSHACAVWSASPLPMPLKWLGGMHLSRRNWGGMPHHTCGFYISKLCWRCVALYLILSWNSSSQDTIQLVQGGRSPLFHETTAVTYSYGLESGLILCLRTSTKKFVRPGAQLRRDRWCQIFQIPWNKKDTGLGSIFCSNGLSVQKFDLVVDWYFIRYREPYMRILDFKTLLTMCRSLPNIILKFQ